MQGAEDYEGAIEHGIEIGPRVRVARDAVRWSFSRSSGPGGQNVNKLSTKAELRVEVDVIPIPARTARRLRSLAGKRVIGAETYVDEFGHTHERGGDLVITSDSERSQERNKSECFRALRDLIVRALVEPKVRRKTKPSRASKERRIDAKKRRGDVKRGRGREEG